MGIVSRQDIEAAAARIEGRVRRTPVIHLEATAFGLDAEISLKLAVRGSSANTRLKGVQPYRVPSTRSGVSWKALVDLNGSDPSDTSP